MGLSFFEGIHLLWLFCLLLLLVFREQKGAPPHIFFVWRGPFEFTLIITIFGLELSGPQLPKLVRATMQLPVDWLKHAVHPMSFRSASCSFDPKMTPTENSKPRVKIKPWSGVRVVHRSPARGHSRLIPGGR